MDKKQKQILEVLKEAKHGLTIQNLIDKTGLARGTIKTKLMYLMLSNNVMEINYGQNTKVYWHKQRLFRHTVFEKNLNSIDVSD